MARKRARFSSSFQPRKTLEERQAGSGLQATVMKKEGKRGIARGEVNEKEGRAVDVSLSRVTRSSRKGGGGRWPVLKLEPRKPDRRFADSRG